MSLNGSKLLSIPGQEALFTTVKNSRPAEETCNSPADDDDDEEAEESYTLVPRSSPVPRRRGLSVFDETAEYMTNRLAMPSRRVSFVDSRGGDLVEVKEFVAFDSDEEEDPRWEEEQARYRPARSEPIYQLCPDFQAPTSAALHLAVQANKVEVESVSTVEDEPLAFTGLIRVLNICFSKTVYVRFTMDSWGTYFDYPADYVQGSNDLETDLYSFKLSFAPPYITHGSKIEFVLRFETPEGDYWANNAGRNYAMVLNLSHKENGERGNGVDDRKLKSILKPTCYRMEDDYEETLATDNGEEDSSSVEAEMVVPKLCPMLPQIIQPEIDIETKDARPSSPPKSDTDLQRVESVPLYAPASPSEKPSSTMEWEVATKVTVWPLTTEPQPEPQWKPNFTEVNRVIKEVYNDSVSGAQSCSHDTKTALVFCLEGSETLNALLSESNGSRQTATTNPPPAILDHMPLLHFPHPQDIVKLDKDEDPKYAQLVTGEGDPNTPSLIEEPATSIPGPHKEPETSLPHAKDTGAESKQDNKGHLKDTGALKSYQSLVSERQVPPDKPVKAYLGLPVEARESIPADDSSAVAEEATGEMKTVSQDGGEELGHASACVWHLPLLTHHSTEAREDRLFPSLRAQHLDVPSPDPVLHFLPQQHLEHKLDTEFNESAASVSGDWDPTESLAGPPVVSAGELFSEENHVSPGVVASIAVDNMVPSASQGYTHVPDKKVLVEHAEEFSCYSVAKSDSTPQSPESQEHQEVVFQQKWAIDLPITQSDQSTASLHQAISVSLAFLTFAFCLVLAFQHPYILPLAVLYFISITF